MSVARDAAPSARDARGLFFLFVGVVSVGAAAILVRLAAAPPLTASFVRLFVGAVVLVVVVAVRAKGGDLVRGAPWPRGPELRRAITAGLLLAAHFALWIASLSATTVTASVVLVCLQPVFVAVFARVFLGEAAAGHVVAGIVVAFVGAAFIAVDGSSAGDNSAVGNALALGGAVAIAVYVLVLRAQKGDVLATSAVVTSTAALATLPLALLSSQPLLPSSSSQAAWLLLLALGPQVVGHTALNAALKRLPAAVVSGSILGEPVIASGLAFAILDEKPGWKTGVGAVITLVGLVLLLRRR